MSGLYTYAGGPGWRDEFLALERQLERPAAALDAIFSWLPEIDSGAISGKRVVVPFARVPAAELFVESVHLVSLHGVEPSVADYWTLMPALIRNGASMRVGDPRSTESRVIQPLIPVQWEVKRPTEPGDFVGVAIEWTGSPGVLGPIAGSVTLRRGRSDA